MAKGLLIAIGKPKGKDEGDDYAREEKEEEGSEGEAASALAELLDLPEEKHAQFKSALESYVRACVDKAMDEANEAKE